MPHSGIFLYKNLIDIQNNITSVNALFIYACPLKYLRYSNGQDGEHSLGAPYVFLCGLQNTIEYAQIEKPV